MRLLISIANYGDHQLHYLQRTLDNFTGYEYETSMVIDTTVDVSHVMPGKRNVAQRMFERSVGPSLPFKHREYFAKNIANYDLFLYTENDHLIPQHAIDFIVNESEELEDDEIMGFMRYETENGVCYLNDLDIATPISKFHAWKKGENIFFTPHILHSGCYLLTQKQLGHAIDSGGYLTKPHIGPYGMLEQGASDVYTQCGFKSKFLPLPVDPVLIHHMPNKYIRMPSALPHFRVDVLSVLSNKRGDMPRLKPFGPHSTLRRLYKHWRYELSLLERKVRRRIKNDRQSVEG